MINNRNFRIYYILLFSLLLSGCDRTWDIVLYEQKIENSSKILYNYDAWGGRDSNINGFVIKDSTEIFKVNVQELLAIHYLINTPDKSNIRAVTFTSFEDSISGEQVRYTPLKVSKNTENDISVFINKYQYKGFSERNQGYEEYNFEKFNETRDSIYFL